jgi:hypothetical protein
MVSMVYSNKLTKAEITLYLITISLLFASFVKYQIHHMEIDKVSSGDEDKESDNKESNKESDNKESDNKESDNKESNNEGFNSIKPDTTMIKQQNKEQYVSRMPDIPVGDENSNILGTIVRSASRGDNLAARYNIRLQRRSVENMINTTRLNRRALDDIYTKELDNNETREWWNVDHLEQPIQKLI